MYVLLVCIALFILFHCVIDYNGAPFVDDDGNASESTDDELPKWKQERFRRQKEERKKQMSTTMTRTNEYVEQLNDGLCVVFI
jgi:hypothetical protein